MVTATTSDLLLILGACSENLVAIRDIQDLQIRQGMVPFGHSQVRRPHEGGGEADRSDR